MKDLKIGSRAWPWRFGLLTVILTLAGCVFDAKVGPPRILFLGNSITMHYKKESVGWHIDAGMAATTVEKDYVHQTVRILKENGMELDPVIGSRDCIICESVIGEHLENVEEVRELNPPYVVVQLGENSSAEEIANGQLEQQYRNLIEAIRIRSSGRIFCISDWDEASLNDPRNTAIRSAISQYPEIHLVDITALAHHPENYGDTALFANPGVAWHPGDLGMQRIAESLAAAILETR